jgi:hypothetical protein
VNIQDVPIPWFVLLRDTTDRAFVYSDCYDGRPLEDVAKDIKAQCAVLSQQQPPPPEEIPEDARKAAVIGLEMWQRMAASDPSSFKVSEMRDAIPTATLADCYISYELGREELERYVRSDTLDPTVFCFYRFYVWPVVSDGDYLGGVRVGLHRHRDGTRWEHTTPEFSVGDYGVTGFEVRGQGEGERVYALEQALGETSMKVLGMVRFMSTNVPDYILLSVEGRRCFLPSYRAPIMSQFLSGGPGSLDDMVLELGEMDAVKDGLRRRMATQRPGLQEEE